MTKKELAKEKKDFEEAVNNLGNLEKFEIFEINTGEYEAHVSFICIALKDFNFDVLWESRHKKKRDFDNFQKFLIEKGYCQFIHVKNFYLES